ncbi:N-acetylneuraminate synthase [Salidesulfovibrio brasiliensis]|uniref:N-acetylneuraminate synthase n=1 Tax=Salidesulfovibrio brasiliensis TaxID=221711 RepID=UPI0006CFF051|nr:N-acetylneuraminate synthase [Salidesulfovibrio brasiliensis]
MTRTYIIAEAGVNHDGRLERALELVDVAADAGADAVKFQTFRSGDLVCSHAGKAEYQKRTTDPGQSQQEMLRALELDLAAHEALIHRCGERGIEFLSTPFDPASVDLLAGLGLKTFKVPSGEITNLPYLRQVAAHAERVVMSTGMAELDEIAAALDVLAAEGVPADAVTLLHCNSAYPTPPEDLNLRAMPAMLERFGTEYPGLRAGLSDHSVGIEAPLAAVAMGATLVEKHFTLDRDADGPDHQASLAPQELKDMVRGIRLVETMLGTGIKRVTESERENRQVVRKSIVAAMPIRKGELFSEQNLAAKRPGAGLSPMRWDDVVGRRAKRDFARDEEIEV